MPCNGCIPSQQPSKHPLTGKLGLIVTLPRYSQGSSKWQLVGCILSVCLQIIKCVRPWSNPLSGVEYTHQIHEVMISSDDVVGADTFFMEDRFQSAAHTMSCVYGEETTFREGSQSIRVERYLTAHGPNCLHPHFHPSLFCTCLNSSCAGEFTICKVARSLPRCVIVSPLV